MKKHGRRSASASAMEDSAHHGSNGNDNVFVLGLKPPDDKSFQPSVDVVQSEYAHRFLEQLGVKPTQKTLDMVHKSVPLTDKCLKANLRSKGHVEDQLHITVPHIEHNFKVPTIADPIEIMQLGMFNATRGANASTSTSSTGLLGGVDSNLDEVKEPAGSLFKRLASSYIYPLNLDAGITKERLDRFSELTRASFKKDKVEVMNSMHISESFGTTTTTPAGFSLVRQSTLRHDLMSQVGGGKDAGLDMDMVEELLRDLKVTPEIVLAVLSQLESALSDWYKAQAAETLKGRLSQQEFMDTLELLSSDSSMKFYITCLNFMYEEYVRRASNFPRHLESKVIKKTQKSPSAHDKKSKGSLVAGSVLTKGQALQKYDNGYAIFVKTRMESLESAPAADTASAYHGLHRSASSTSHAASHASSVPSSDRMRCHVSSSAGASGPMREQAAGTGEVQASSRKSIISDLTRNGGLSHQASETPSRVQFSQERDQGEGLASSARGRRGPGLQPSAVSFAGLGDRSSSETGTDSELDHELGLRSGARPQLLDPLEHERIISSSEAVRRSMRHLPSFSAAAAATQSMSIMKGLGQTDLNELQQARLYSLQKEFAEVYQQYRSSRAGMFFKLPIFFLSIRLLVSLLFTSLFSIWSKTPEGSEALEQMDQAMLMMFDPHEYLQRNLSLIQSTPTAVSILAKHPHLSHGPERVHFNDTSALLRAALTDPKSAGARRMMVGSGNKLLNKVNGAAVSEPKKKLMQTVITNEQQDALFRDALRQVLLEKSRRPGLAQLGEPVGSDGRASWLDRSK